jgi:hypothetical protein
MLVDDDKFLTRWCWRKEWKTVFYNHEEALMRTSIAVTGWPQLSQKMHRWVRTSWRSKPTELFVERNVWTQQPWSLYATYFATTFNIALIYDSLLWVSLFRSGWAGGLNGVYFGFLLLASKLVKPFPHLLRCKRDILYIPIGILFGYYHGFIRLWALFTVHDILWGGRNLKEVSHHAPIPPPQAAASPTLSLQVDHLKTRSISEEEPVPTDSSAAQLKKSLPRIQSEFIAIAQRKFHTPCQHPGTT